MHLAGTVNASRGALILALAACMLAGAALAVAMASRPAPSRFGLVCGQTFTSVTGRQAQMYVPCTDTRMLAADSSPLIPCLQR